MSEPQIDAEATLTRTPLPLGLSTSTSVGMLFSTRTALTKRCRLQVCFQAQLLEHNGVVVIFIALGFLGQRDIRESFEQF